MAETPDQIRPLAAASDRPQSSDDEEPSTTKLIRRRRLVRCCAGVSAILLILAIVIVVLIFTVFRVRDPIIRMNKVTLAKFDLAAGATTGANITVIADLSVKNPNYASFRYDNTTTTLYYREITVGEARGPAGRARARRTMRMNLTVDVMADRLLPNPELGSDLMSGVLTMSTYTVVGGRVKMAMIKRRVTVKMNCSVTINVTTQAIQQQKCQRKVKL